MEEPAFSPQPYTQKLLDAGVIKFKENNYYDESKNEVDVSYRLTKNFEMKRFNEYYDYPIFCSHFIEIYEKQKFKEFNVYIYEDHILDDLDDDEFIPEQEITIYKQFEL